MSPNLVKRITVAIIAIPVILWISYQGGTWLFGMVLLFALGGMTEFLIREQFKPTGFFFWLGLLAVLELIGIMTGTLDMKVNTEDSTTFVTGSAIIIVLFLLSGMLFSMGKQDPAKLFGKYLKLIWGVLYLGLLYPFVFLVGDGVANLNGGDCLLFLFGLLWVGDTAAMGIGKWLGRHKLAPSVSPNKTIEGFVGGVIGAVIVTIVFYFWKFPALDIVHLIALGIGCSIFGQLGDLVESMWKRSLGIKDSSSIIPGHGGILDRFDSLLFAAPFMYGYLRFILP